MNQPKLLAIGDNVCDKYLSRNKMYPGGQSVNTSVYASMNQTPAAFLGKFGDDAVGDCIKNTLDLLGVDRSHCRQYSGESGFALVTQNGSDRVFLGSNKGGIAKDHPYAFTGDDLAYMKQFRVIYSNLNAYLEEELPTVSATGVPIAFDFSDSWTDSYLSRICPYIQIALLSCAHLNDAERKAEMEKVAVLGVPLVLGTAGKKGSYALYNEEFCYTEAVHADNVIDTMGAGDSYFAAFLCSLISSAEGDLLPQGQKGKNVSRIRAAMKTGAAFAAKVCTMEGAFGYGTPIVGRTEV